MANDTKMLQLVLDGQSEIRKDIKKLEGKLEKKIDENGNRIDKLGKQLAYLEDDAPTRKEYDKLEKRVSKLETQFTTT